MERLNNYPLHESMRGYFGYELYKAMAGSPDVYLLTGDLGYKMFDPHLDYKERFINCGASEMTMLGMAVGLAKEGKMPFTYTISSFYMRGAELIELYVAKEKLPIIMIGSGRNNDYLHDGPSHDATAAQDFMRLLNIKSYYPKTKEQMPDLMKELLTLKESAFVSLTR